MQIPRIVRRVLVVPLLLGAWAFVGSHRPPVPVTLGDALAGPGASRDAQHEALGAPEHPPHDLANPKIFTKVILYVKDNYVDPSRVHPKEMMLASLEYVEKVVPDVLVEGNVETGKLRVTVGSKAQSFDISHVDSLWKMSFTLKDVFRFISDNMKPMEDTHEVEYAAVNGMLSKLDPHSVLLRPELYREMKLTTKGEFGGLGFVIQMKEGNLTVVKVLPKTPAFRAGIKKDDQIKKIGEESTINMDLNEAVGKLRGPVDSQVTITLERKSWDKPQVMTLSRAMISIESVQAKLLAQNVAYVRLKNFQGNTTRDLQAALRGLEQQAQPAGGLKGLVLDLRGNPGGLLEQAIQVSDLFLSHGVIVATVGFSDKMREEKRAHPDPEDDKYPVAVLVNAGSASASEIVAGALKNLDRAVLIGRRTFGKGSVQVLYDFPDDSALKLTIAKYLTPGDVSIQETGIVPDVELVPTRVTQDRVDVFAPRKSMGEADLDSHFANGTNEVAATKRDDVLDRDKPLFQVKYLKEDEKEKDVAARQQLEEEGRAPKPPKSADKGGAKQRAGADHGTLDEELDDQLDAETQDDVKEDFEVLFARDFVLHAPSMDRKQMLSEGRDFVGRRTVEEGERINAAIAKLGIDWTPGPSRNVKLASTGQLVATLSPSADVPTKAGEELDLKLTVENKGTAPLHRLRAWTDSQNPLLDRREFLFGALGPGEKRSWDVPIQMPKDLISRRDAVAVKFFDDGGQLPETLTSELSFAELPKPTFAFGWQIVDACDACNGDGLVERGEQVNLVVDVTNTGAGTALDSYAQIKNAADENIFIEKGRFKLGELAPGETKTARFVFDVKDAYSGTSFPLKLAIVDEPLEAYTSEKLELPIAARPAEVVARKGVLRLNAGAQLFASPEGDARVVARAGRPAVVEALGKVAGFYKVALDKDRWAFVGAADAKETRGRPAPPKDLQWVAARVPPKISLDVDLSKGGLVAEGGRFTLSGTVSAPKQNLDVYVLVNDQKVFFKGVSSRDPGAGTLRFTANFPLKEGNNSVMVVAREDADFGSHRTLVIHRRAQSIAQTVSPPPGDAKASTP